MLGRDLTVRYQYQMPGYRPAGCSAVTKAGRQCAKDVLWSRRWFAYFCEQHKPVTEPEVARYLELLEQWRLPSKMPQNRPLTTARKRGRRRWAGNRHGLPVLLEQGSGSPQLLKVYSPVLTGIGLVLSRRPGSLEPKGYRLVVYQSKGYLCPSTRVGVLPRCPRCSGSTTGQTGRRLYPSPPNTGR